MADTPSSYPSNRPQQVMIAAILLFVAGGLAILGGILLLQLGGVLLLWALLSLAIGAVSIYAGMQVMALREQGRVIGMALAGVGVVLQLISLISYFNIVTLLTLLLYGAILYLLYSNAEHFRR